MTSAPLAQEFLQTAGSLSQLESAFKVHARRGTFPLDHLVSLKYDMIESDFSLPLVRECRGLVLDESDNWAVVARPFDKFFNLGESKAATIDWTTAKVQEKLDGSLILLYYYAPWEAWLVGTSGTPDASGTVSGADFTFEQLFWRVFMDLGYQLPDPERAKEWCFMFELCTAYNRVVVRHERQRLVLLGARRKDGLEVDAPFANHFLDLMYEEVRQFRLHREHEVISTLATMNPVKQEGYVVCDAQFNRVKVKCPAYLALHRIKGNGYPSKGRLLELIQMGEMSEVLAVYPEWIDDMVSLRDLLDEAVLDIESDYAVLKDIEDQKAFAAEALQTRCPHLLFQLRKGYIPSVRRGLLAMRTEHLLEALRVK
jgi:hypothetical protein